MSRYYAGPTTDTRRVRVVAGGTWIRDVALGAPGFQSTPTVYVDSATGNDDADGLTQQTSIATRKELLYRIGSVTPVDGNDSALIAENGIGVMYAYFTGDQANTTETVSASFVNDGGVAFVGTRSVLAQYTITAVTAYNTSTGVVGAYTLSGAPNITALGYINKLIRINAGVRQGNKGTIAAYLGSGVVLVRFADQDVGAAIEPQVGDTVDVYDVPRFCADLRLASGPSGQGGGSVFFEAMQIGVTGANHSIAATSGQTNFIGCQVHSIDVYKGAVGVLLNCCGVYEARSLSKLRVTGSTFYSAGGANLNARSGGIIEIDSPILIYGGGLSAGHATEGPGDVTAATPFAVVNYPATALTVSAGSTVVLNDYMTIRDSNGASAGISVDNGGSVMYASGKAPIIAGTAPTPNFNIGGTSVSAAGLAANPVSTATGNNARIAVK